MRSCAPPEKNMPRLDLILSTSSESCAARFADCHESAWLNCWYKRGATRMWPATAPCLARVSIICAADFSGSPEAVANTANFAPLPPAKSTIRCQKASLSYFSAPPKTMAMPGFIAGFIVWPFAPLVTAWAASCASAEVWACAPPLLTQLELVAQSATKRPTRNLYVKQRLQKFVLIASSFLLDNIWHNISNIVGVSDYVQMLPHGDISAVKILAETGGV